VLRISELKKTYPNGVRALRNISLEIPTGMFGLIGPNGAGKSTLMRTIATLQEPDSGSITLNGIDVLRDKQQVRELLGYLPQEFGVYPKVTAEAMLDHFAILKGITNTGERREVVEGLLRMTNLWELRRQKLGTYSGGTRQRFGIAQALLGDPKLLIVDEPTAGLDPEERDRFLNLLSEIGSSVVVILSTHIVEDVTEREVIDGVRGMIWRKQVGRQELAELAGHLQIISSRLQGGRTIIHVYSPERPHDGFEVVEPDLKDVYFSTLKLRPQAA
jgi:ABC-type multidrug transport system ATPase subunit